jgi:hypothetical protein
MATQEAEGGESLAANILANMTLLARDAIVKANKNIVKLAMFDLLRANEEWCKAKHVPIPRQVWYKRNADGSVTRVTDGPTAPEKKIMRDIKTQIREALVLVNEVEIEMTRMILGNELALQFAFKKAPIIEGVPYDVVITKTYADGREAKVVEIPVSQWKSAPIDGEAYYYVSFNGIAAKEMSDGVDVNVVVNDKLTVSKTYSDSIREYAVRQLRRATEDVTKALYVDMLNYGAAAQTYFEYDAKNLSNADLTAAEQAYATKEVKLENNLKKGDNYVASQLNLASSIQLRAKFDNIDASMYAIVSFTNHVGRKIEVKVDGSKFLQGNVVVVDAVVAADYEQDVTITVYNAEGKAVASVVDSVASYIARMSGEDAPVIYDAVAKYTASAYAYLHQ